MRFNSRERSFIKRCATVVGALSLAACFALTAAPSAAASPSNGSAPNCAGRPGACPGWPPGPGNHAYAVQPPSPALALCDGRVPGICPGSTG